MKERTIKPKESLANVAILEKAEEEFSNRESITENIPLIQKKSESRSVTEENNEDDTTNRATPTPDNLRCSKMTDGFKSHLPTPLLG